MSLVCSPLRLPALILSRDFRRWRHRLDGGLEHRFTLPADDPGPRLTWGQLLLVLAGLGHGPDPVQLLLSLPGSLSDLAHGLWDRFGRRLRGQPERARGRLA